MRDDFKAKLDAFADQYYQTNKNSGVLRITHQDEIIYEKYIGYANAEKEIAFTRDSMFTFYSMTKPLCAIALMKLKDRGLWI